MLMYRRSWFAPSTLLLLWSAAPAWAQTKTDESSFKLDAGYTRLSDSNPLRLPSGTSDQINISTLGFSFNTRQSLQQFELNLNLINHQYQRFTDRNFTAHNYNAAWRWAVTPRLHGNFTTDRKQSLNTDLLTANRNESLNTQSNPGSLLDAQGVPRTNTKTRFDALYEVDGVWRVLGGVSKSNQTNLLTQGQTPIQTLVIGEDYRSSSADLGLRYAFTSGSALTYTVKKTEGKYFNHLASSDGLYDGSFHQLDNELRLHWILTGNTTADLSAAHVSRTHPHFSQLDYSGLNTGIKINWNITGKTALAASWTRELASDQHDANSPNDDFNYNSTHSQTNRLSIGPVWKVSAKTVVRLNYEMAQRDYQGSPTGVDAAAQRSDTLHNTVLAVAWQPYKYVTLGASLQRASRSSNLPNLDYDSNMATLSAKFSY